MRVSASRLEAVPGESARVRLAARVSYDAASAPSDEYWFEMPAGIAASAVRDGNPWLAALLPLAATLGEPLEWELPVDRPLVEGAREVLRIWKDWYPKVVQVLPLRGPMQEAASHPPPQRTGAFLSGGVDSFFTALDHVDGSAIAERGRIDEFLFVGGFDLRLDAMEGIARALGTVRDVAAALGRPLVDVRTNLRDRSMRWSRAVDWGWMGHGPVLASVALSLGSRYRRVLIPASNFEPVPAAWGSTPLTDRLLSSWTLEIRDDGAGYDRPEKVRAIAASDLARRHLRVCFKSMDGTNCGRCPKCLLTMLMLDAAVGLPACPTFPSPLDHGAVRSLSMEKHWDRRHMRHLRRQALADGRSDIVETVDRLLGWRNRVRTAVRKGRTRVFGLRPFRRALRRAFRQEL